MKTILMIVLTSVAILGGGCATSHSHTTDWEYKVVSGKFNLPLEQEINKAAADGWVLVSAGGQTDAYGFAVLKRHKKSQ
jgi:hypothetical protein